MFQTIVKAGILAALLTISFDAAAQTTRRVRGSIEAFDGNTLVVQSRQGETVKIAIAPSYTVAAMSQGDLSAVKPGAYIGIVSTGPRDQMVANVVTVFPEGQSRASEGQFPWDSQPNSTMTNAPVESQVTAAQGGALTVTVKGEKQVMQVAPDAIIAVTTLATPALVVPGAKVIIFAQQGADGTLSANRINVGRDGFTPPM